VILIVLLPPKTTAVADGASESRVPEILIAVPPGIRVCVPIVYCEAELAVIVVPASGMTG
jgi:hypothetical protein